MLVSVVEAAISQSTSSRLLADNRVQQRTAVFRDGILGLLSSESFLLMEVIIG
jgi:hypothetical protein